MGCWGITALESDTGLDAVGFIREQLPEDGKLELEQILQALRQDGWNAPPEAGSGESHTSPMALAELVVKLADRDMTGLDYSGEWAAEYHQFADVTSFGASKESLRWLREYLADTLLHAVRNAGQGRKWNGWFEQKDWIDWQGHMGMLIGRLDGFLASEGNHVELLPENQEPGQVMK